MHPQSSVLIFIAVVALLAWRMYSRIRRVIGRQHLSPRRPWVTVVLFPVLILLLGRSAFASSAATFGLIAGIGIGTALGFYGLQLTKFERTSEGLFYTPNAHIGVALSVVLVVRIVYRLGQTLLGGPPPPPGQLVYGPLTLTMLGTMAGYYVTYAIGLLKWSRRVAGEPPGPSPAPDRPA